MNALVGHVQHGHSALVVDAHGYHVPALGEAAGRLRSEYYTPRVGQHTTLHYMMMIGVLGRVDCKTLHYNTTLHYKVNGPSVPGLSTVTTGSIHSRIRE